MWVCVWRGIWAGIRTRLRHVSSRISSTVNVPIVAARSWAVGAKVHSLHS